MQFFFLVNKYLFSMSYEWCAGAVGSEKARVFTVLLHLFRTYG